MTIQLKLGGRVALITGGTSGIRRATAVLLAKEGTAVALTGRNQDRGEEVAQGIKQAGGKALFIRVDVRIADDCRKAVELTLERFSRIDVLFNNAGVFHPKTVGECTEEEWDETIDSSLKGAFLMSRYALPWSFRLLQRPRADPSNAMARRASWLARVVGDAGEEIAEGHAMCCRMATANRWRARASLP